MLATDTITAIATAPGRGGIGIVRVSGPNAKAIGDTICGKTLQARLAQYCQFSAKSEVLDTGIALYFPGPASFTGEDVLELQGHGGPIIMDLLLRETLNLGARQARPGEFSERAFLNNKLDLAQAEAIADLIDSATQEAARSASRSLQGEFSRQIHALVESITALRIYLEAAIDFPEEEGVDFIAEGDVAGQLDNLLSRCTSILIQAERGSLIREGMKLVLAGEPNAGKSSLLNALSGTDRAIVTPIEGTTRDLLHEHIEIDGLPLHIVDTAGLRESTDAIEQEGIRRARTEMESADRILLVLDASTRTADMSREQLAKKAIEQVGKDIPLTIINNKCDLSGQAPGLDDTGDYPSIILSAKSGAGLDQLREHLKGSMGYHDHSGGSFSARRRHLEALKAAQACLLTGQEQLLGHGAGELLAEDLRQCQDHLGEITGAISSDELLGKIFSSFCIGK